MIISPILAIVNELSSKTSHHPQRSDNPHIAHSNSRASTFFFFFFFFTIALSPDKCSVQDTKVRTGMAVSDLSDSFPLKTGHWTTVSLRIILALSSTAVG